MANEWANKALPRADKNIAPAVWDENKQEWVVVQGRDGRMWVRDDSLERELKELKQQNKEILERLDKPIDTNAKLTGSNVEQEYDGEIVVKTRTMGLAWNSFNPFNTQTLLVPSATYIDRSGDAVKVNGYSTLGLIVRDTVVAGRGKFYISVYWTSKDGSLDTTQAVPEKFNYDPQDNPDIGMSLSIPTKAEYVSFRIHNENGEDRTFYVKGLLRT